jgi:hypothetical protein
MAQLTTPAGWYPDPNQPGQARYENGTGWSQHVQAAPAVPLAEGATQPQWQQWWAIILTLFLCLPFGFIGIWRRKGPFVAVQNATDVYRSIRICSVAQWQDVDDNPDANPWTADTETLDGHSSQ